MSRPDQDYPLSEVPLSARKSQLMGDIAKITAQQIQNPGIAAEYDRINGEYTAFKAQYDKLLAQREQVRLRGDVQTETDAIKIELLDPPSKPTSPAAPNRPSTPGRSPQRPTP